MTRDTLRTFYRERMEFYRESARKQNRTINLIALLRLATLAVSVYLLVLGISGQELFFYLLSAAGAAIFFLLVLHFNRLKDSRELARQLEDLNETEISCLDHRFRHLPEGNEFADPSHPWSHDLDLFGKGSLYQYLNRTCTPGGKRVLARMLTTEPGDLEEVLHRQGMVTDLKERVGFRQDYTAQARMIREGESDLGDVDRWLRSRSYITGNPWLFYLAIAVSSVSLVFLTMALAGFTGYTPLLFILIFNWLVLSPFIVRTNRYQSVISRKHQLLEGYAALLKRIVETGFIHTDLVKNREQARRGMHEIKRLSRLLNLFDQRLNMLMGVVFNSLFLFDFIMLHLLEGWKKRNREQVPGWLDITADTEALVSLAGFGFNHPAYVFPDLEDSFEDLELLGIGHPLIPDAKRVVNDLEAGSGKVVIITGANMAGKSTFLRSLGVNTVLAYAGCPVCARRFRTGFMGLHSSMRTADSLAEEESYFLAEIKRLQQIVKRMETGRPMMILLDEVLKGTNTTDKKKGSVGLIRRSLDYPVRIFIATHDLSLGDLEKEHPAEIVNYCFESYIRDLELAFDYTIRRGIATSMNASFLMKKMGIMD